jgi:cell division protein FtsQ
VGLSAQHALFAACGVLVLALGVTLATGDRAGKLGSAANVAVGSRFAALGFKLQAVRVQGASKLATADILKAADVYKDMPLLGMDLDRLQADIQSVGWVKSVRVVRLLPDTLVLQIVERPQVAIWQDGGYTRVIDDKGEVIPEADARMFAKLPLVVGEGANNHATQILNAVSQRPGLMSRVEAMVRVDDRRWDLRLKDGSLIQLPGGGVDAALIALEQLEVKSRILELGFERIDLRNPEMVSVRPRVVSAPGPLVADGA